MKNNKDTIIHKYFIDKLKPVDIAKELNISKSAVTQVLQKDKRYVKEKNNRKMFFRRWFNWVKVYET